MKILEVLLLTLLAILVKENNAATDYCVKSLQDQCKVQGFQGHIGCNNSKLFDSSCVKATQVPITTDLKTQILKKHNDFRNKIALGQEPRYSPASRMAQTVWNDELASLAELNTKQCKMQHDCHNTLQFSYSGQNIGIQGASKSFQTPTSVVDAVITDWYNENANANQSDIDRLTRIQVDANLSIGHFTALVNDHQIAVGCAISQYFSGYFWTLMTCNYASTNMPPFAVYKVGKVASGCTNGADLAYPGLCKTSEIIDPSPFSSMVDESLIL